MIDDSPSSYHPSSYADTLPTSFRTSTAFQTPTTSTTFQTPTTSTTFQAPTTSASSYNNGSSSNLRQSLSSSRLNNNNSSSSSGNGNKYGRLSRHFSIDDDANDASTSFHPTTSSYISPDSYVTLTRRRRQGEPSVVEKYFSPTTTSSSSMPLSRQGSMSSFESRDQTSFPPRPSPARYVASNLSKSSSSGNNIA